MFKTKIFLSTITTLGLFLISSTFFFAEKAQAQGLIWAKSKESFFCQSQLEYVSLRSDNTLEVKRVPAQVWGQRSASNSLASPVYVQAGRLSFRLSMPYHSLSRHKVVIEGFRVDTQSGLKMDYKRSQFSGGDWDRPYNNYLEVHTRKGSQITRASNKVIDPVTFYQTGEYHPVVCDIR